MLNQIRKDRKKELYEATKITPLGIDMYRVLEDFKYYDIVVPAGFETNGANVPRILWSFFPPNRSDYMPAVIVHDYLTDKDEYGKADFLFDKLLKELMIQPITHFCLVKAVKIYHLIRYRTKWNYK